ncbi:MAG: gluconate:H+ symporter [Mucilaginibacter sp.]
MALIIVFLCVLSLILLITWARINTFLAFLLVSTMAALLLGMPVNKIVGSISKGIGDTLGSLVIIIVLGAMLGKLVASSGAAQKIASVLKIFFGPKYVTWAMTITGFIVGIPLYYNVGFVLLIPIIFSVAYNYKLPLVYVGLPMLASLSVMHGFVPPHPSPTALVVQFHADITKTFFYGIIIAVPAIVIAGPLFAATLKNLKSNSVIAQPQEMADDELPGITNSIFSSLLPVILIGITTLIAKFSGNHPRIQEIVMFLGDANIAMIGTIFIATYSLGVAQGKNVGQVMECYTEGVKDIAMILLIIASAGILKQIFVDSGVSDQMAAILKGINLPPLLLAWIITAILRLCLGSATIAGLTAAGIVYPLTLNGAVDVNLMVLSVGAGSLFCSHVNDTSFWMFKEYFGLSMKDTFRSWSLMETLVSIIGLIGVLCINMVI